MNTLLVQTICLVMGVAAVVFAYLLLRGDNLKRKPDRVFEGRQQIRRGVRQEAARQLRGAPINRRVRRQAARDIAQALRKAKESDNG